MKDKLRTEFKSEDATRMIRETFQRWIDENKASMKADEVLRIFDRKFGELDEESRRMFPDRTKTFLQALPDRWAEAIGLDLCLSNGD